MFKKPSRETERELMLMLGYVFLLFGTALFFASLHNVDLSQHYYKAGTNTIFDEVALDGGVWSIDQTYALGLMGMIAGMFLYGVGNFCFALGFMRMKEGRKNEKRS